MADLKPAKLNIATQTEDLYIFDSSFIQFIFSDDDGNPLEHTVITKNELFTILSARTHRIDAMTPDLADKKDKDNVKPVDNETKKLIISQLEIHDTSGKSTVLDDGIVLNFMSDGVICKSYGLHIATIKEALTEYFERRKGSNKSFYITS